MATLDMHKQPLDDRPPKSVMDTSMASSKPKISLSLGARKAPTSTALKRPRSMLEESHAEEQVQQETTITQFGGPSEPVKQTTVAKVIQAQPNRDWRDATKQKRQKSSLPGDAKAQQNGDSSTTRDVVNGSSLGYGLINAQPSPRRDAATPDASNDSGNAAGPTPTETTPPPQTDDERAMAALLGTHQPSTTAIIAAPPPTEDAVFRSDYASAPPMATLDEYAAMPVEEFGAALLRGQGWREGEGIGRGRHGAAAGGKERVVARRPALLGIGAKESGMGVELGAWGKGARPGGGNKAAGPRAAEMSYNPVALRNKKTGELLTEEELKAKLEAQKAGDAAAPLREEGRSRAARIEGVRDSGESRLQHRDSDRDSDRRRDKEHRKSSRRERSTSAESRHRRHRYDDDEGYRERKDKERRRRDREKDERYDSSSSRRHRRDGERTYDSDGRR